MQRTMRHTSGKASGVPTACQALTWNHMCPEPIFQMRDMRPTASMAEPGLEFGSDFRVLVLSGHVPVPNF